jgi:hypothetical protein
MVTYEVLDEVVIVQNMTGSVNKVGDRGVITHKDRGVDDSFLYRVLVPNRSKDSGNWHYSSDLMLLCAASPEEVVQW